MHLHFYTENVGVVNEEQWELFHKDVKEMGKKNKFKVDRMLIWRATIK